MPYGLLDLGGLLAYIAHAGCERDELPLDLRQPIGLGSVIPAREAGQYQFARDASRRAGNDKGASLQLLDVGDGEPQRDRARRRLGSTIDMIFQ